MPWADTVFQDLDNWADCVWQDWDDCIWDRFSIVYQDRKKGTMRQLPPQALSNSRRPYLEGNPSYVEDSLRYPDKAYADAKMQARGEEVRHMEFKQPYRYKGLPKMKYRDEPAFAHQETMSAQNMMGGGGGGGGGVGPTPDEIVDEEKEVEREWQWLRHFDDSHWTPTSGQWFDNRWITFVAGVATNMSPLSAASASSIWSITYNAAGAQAEDACTTRWLSGAGAYPHWIEMDWTAEGSTTITEVRILFSDEDGEHVRDYQVQYWDGDSWETVVTVDDFSDWGNEQVHSVNFTSTKGRIYCTDGSIGDVAAGICEVEFRTGGSTIDLTVLGEWYKDLRPEKFRMTFANATANVSLKDGNGTEIYANATYASQDEVDLAFAGADISRLIIIGSGDLADIEFLVSVEEGSYAASDQRTPRGEADSGMEQTSFPDPSPIQEGERLARRPNLRATRGE